MVEVGDAAPDFSAPNDKGGNSALKDYRGQNLILYFYPKDGTPGCTSEANDFRDYLETFKTLNTSIVGVSRDSLKRHINFSKKNQLNFPLISDEDGKICENYGVWQKKQNYGRSYMGIVRSTFLINSEGSVAEVWKNVRVKGHIESVVKAVKKLC
ncbi:MAG: thioredoxin-dependent thiol peroxidase [Rhodospirillaceae bacterium]